MNNRSIRVGRLIVTTAMQGGGAPLFDRCRVEDRDGWAYYGWLMLLTPWRRNRYGESKPQRGLVVGWAEYARASVPPQEQSER
jgi:hypothetical protein